MSKELVKLPREVAEAIETMNESMKFNVVAIIDAAKSGFHSCAKVIDEFIHYNDENARLYFSALVNGYEIEETPEDKVKYYFLELRQEDAKWTAGRSANSSPFGYELTGCVRTLNLLGLKIEGVNA